MVLDNVVFSIDVISAEFENVFLKCDSCKMFLKCYSSKARIYLQAFYGQPRYIFLYM